jgi:ribosomal-protein-alanine N-acetyltransferase
MTNFEHIFPDLESERFYLRQLTDSDVDFIYGHFSNASVTEYLMDEPPLSEISEAKAIIDFYRNPESKTHNRWGIVTKSSHQLIGTIGYHKWVKKYQRAEIGFDLKPEYWGQGVMAEAARVVIRFGFEAMNLNRIDGLVYVENARCLKLMQRLGFKIEGKLRDYFSLNGRFYDHFLLSLLKREWKG